MKTKRKLIYVLILALALMSTGCNKNAVTDVQNSQTSLSFEQGNGNESTTTTADVVNQNPYDELTEMPYGYLKELFAAHNMKVGTCLSAQMISNQSQNALILEQFSSITMENSMKPDYIFNKDKSKASGELVVEFNKDAIKMLDWAKENNMAVRGHTLVWYSQTPQWIFHEGFDTKNDLVSREVMLSRMESYIKQVFEQLTELGYIDLFYAYDVVNEAWMEDGKIRESNWTKTIGEDYLWYAFYYADMYAPEHIDLYYNDYNEQYKTDTLVKFVKTLVDENGVSLIDGIGLQAHLYTQDSLKGYFSTVDKLAECGLKLELTELDVSLGAWQNTLKATDENLRTQGEYYYDLIGGLLERVDSGKINMDALTFWGFSDSLSWRKDASPLLFDKSLKPKYSFYGAMQMKEYAGFEE